MTLRLLASVVFLLVALSACGPASLEPAQPSPIGSPSTGSAPTSVAAPDPTAAPTEDDPTAQPSDSPTAGPDKPLRPDLITEPTEKGAIATAEYFLDLYIYASRTLSVEELEVLSAPECGFCNSILAEIEDWRDAGRSLQGGKVTRSEGGAVAGREGRMEVQLYVEEAAGSIVNSAGSESGSFNATETLLSLYLEYVEGQWVVVSAKSRAR